MNVKRYPFIGKSMSVSAIKRLYPGFPESVIREACEAGAADLAGLHAHYNRRRAERKPFKPGPRSQVTIVASDPALHRAAPRER